MQAVLCPRQASLGHTALSCCAGASAVEALCGEAGDAELFIRIVHLAECREHPVAVKLAHLANDLEMRMPTGCPTRLQDKSRRPWCSSVARAVPHRPDPIRERHHTCAQRSTPLQQHTHSTTVRTVPPACMVHPSMARAAGSPLVHSSLLLPCLPVLPDSSGPWPGPSMSLFDTSSAYTILSSVSSIQVHASSATQRLSSRQVCTDAVSEEMLRLQPDTQQCLPCCAHPYTRLRRLLAVLMPSQLGSDGHIQRVPAVHMAQRAKRVLAQCRESCSVRGDR